MFYFLVMEILVFATKILITRLEIISILTTPVRFKVNHVYLASPNKWVRIHHLVLQHLPHPLFLKRKEE